MIVGITGKARAGKNETSTFLKYMYGFEEFSFASPIRTFVIDFLQLSGLEELDSIKEIPHSLFDGKTPRYVMQTLGTEWGRDTIYDGIWVNRCISMALKSKNAVISDVRFENEAKAIKAAGGVIIEVVRSGAETTKLSDHASETGIPQQYINYVFKNHGSIFDYRQYLTTEFADIFTKRQ